MIPPVPPPASPGTQLMAVLRGLAAARKRAGLTQHHVAARVGTTRQTVTGWEDGTRVPSAENMCRWAHALGVELRIVQPSEKEQTP